MEGSGEGFAEHGGATTAGLQSGKQSMLDDRAGSEPNGRDGLVLREMPNGLNVWCGKRAEEEIFFVYGEVFEDRTYVKTGLRVQDNDTVWDVGELVLLSGAACGRGGAHRLTACRFRCTILLLPATFEHRSENRNYDKGEDCRLCNVRLHEKLVAFPTVMMALDA